MSPEPIIKLEPNGQAPVISYRLPEPTSYAGRHYVELALDTEDFVEEVAVRDGDDRLRMRADTPPEDPMRALTVSDDVLSVSEGPDRSVRVRAVRPLSDELATMRIDDLEDIASSGREAALVPNLAGRLELRVNSLAPESSGESEDPATSTGSGIAGETKLQVSIDSPAANATVTGPSTGCVVQVDGTTAVIRGRGTVARVQVRLDDGPWEDAVVPPGYADLGTWTCKIVVPSSGPHDVEVLATPVGTNVTTAKASVRFTAALSPGPSTDDSAPTLKIVAPLDGTIFVKEDGRLFVTVAGEAYDAVAVERVTVSVDGGAPVMASSVGAEWSASVPVTGLGAHTLTVAARDTAGNEQRQVVRIKVSATAERKLKGLRLMVVESYRLSSFLGRYGAGRTLKTFSLLPGERTKINVRTYRRSEESTRQASSILDSLTDSSSKEFMDALAAEQSNKQSHDDSFKYQLSAKVEQGWGTGRAEVSGGVSGGFNAAREEFGKTVTNVTSKHAASASAKRDVSVNNDYTTKVETGEETSIEREIQNINVGRTLNFVFRQMNQEFVSILHLVDVRLALARIYDVDGRTEIDYREVRLPEMRSLIERCVVPSRRQETHDTVLSLLHNVADYRDKLFDVIEEVVPTKQGLAVPEAGYLRFDRALRQTYTDPVSGSSWTVPGVIIAVTSNVLRTDGVMVDALLGQGEGLDDYSQGLQSAAVKERTLSNAKLDQELAERRQVAQIVADKDEEAAKVYERVARPAVQPPSVVQAGQSDGAMPTP